MKKIISLILSTIIVIVMFSFSNKPYGGAYCASIAINSSCSIIHGQTESPTTGVGIGYYIDKSWDGTPTGCRSNVCSTEVFLYSEPNYVEQ
ncbi:MAG: hypothetical protein P0Y53_24140 [Candidatus Pseudobacter hemicellulosilyticus]|uniref:Uncharacterized protein n=1 Tax=Candidatus Pseudobacter hemicellulosilyticus TaxID=3121375 RepID=A0AAJ6BGT8_9BACT|nr:MAG: hypothetical protein P0Y53_24140 [Pseudobacter sp.]